MTRNQWIVFAIIVLLIIIAIGIGVVLWMQRRNVVVVDTVAIPTNGRAAQVLTGVANKPVVNMKRVDRPPQVGATYRELIGHKSG